jgi:hypothetical protein
VYESHQENSIVVSSDLVRSGLVLLFAAQKGLPLTPRMVRMLGDVRGRVQTLAGCFHRATRLRRGPGPDARKWDAIGGVPIDIIQRSATMARISIAVVDLIELRDANVVSSSPNCWRRQSRDVQGCRRIAPPVLSSGSFTPCMSRERPITCSASSGLE